MKRLISTVHIVKGTSKIIKSNKKAVDNPSTSVRYQKLRRKSVEGRP